MINTLWDNLFRSDRKQKNIATALKNNILFRDLTLGELKLVQNIVHVRHYHSGEPIFQQGDVGVGMYIIVYGSINITVEEISIDGSDSISNFVTRLNEGDFFGEIALVEESGRRTATASAHEDSLVIGFFKPDLLELVNRNPIAGVKILLRLGQVLGTRLAETTAQIKTLKRKIKPNERN